jgi:hypothetical protein
MAKLTELPPLWDPRDGTDIAVYREQVRLVKERIKEEVRESLVYCFAHENLLRHAERHFLRDLSLGSARFSSPTIAQRRWLLSIRERVESLQVQLEVPAAGRFSQIMRPGRG